MREIKEAEPEAANVQAKRRSTLIKPSLMREPARRHVAGRRFLRNSTAEATGNALSSSAVLSNLFCQLLPRSNVFGRFTRNLFQKFKKRNNASSSEKSL